MFIAYLYKSIQKNIPSMGEYITGTCPNCYGTKLVENLDELSCATCGHRIEGHLSLNVVEGNDIFSGFSK